MDGTTPKRPCATMNLFFFFRVFRGQYFFLSYQNAQLPVITT